MPELSLDERQRDPLVQKLNSVRMSELVGREPAPYPSLNGEVTQLGTDGGS